jgi:PKD repeat protein
LRCGGGDALPWLSESPISGTLAGGVTTTQNIQLVWDASVAQVNQPGIYTGSLQIRNSDPLAQNTFVPVTMTVQDPLACSFTSSSPDDLRQVTVFTNTTTGAAPMTYRWSLGDGSSISAATNPTHTYAHVGLYTVVLTATNSVGQDVCTGPVSIEGVEASFVSNSPVAQGTPVVFTNTTQASPAALAWVWDLGDSASSTAQTPPPHTYANVGVYTVTLTAFSTKGSSTYTGSVKVGLFYIYLPIIIH